MASRWYSTKSMPRDAALVTCLKLMRRIATPICWSWGRTGTLECENLSLEEPPRGYLHVRPCRLCSRIERSIGVSISG
jgi:hypothetical protein